MQINEVCAFYVVGIPRPGGSKRVFVNRATGKPIVTDDSRRNKDWRNAVANAAADTFRGPLLTGLLMTEMIFYFPRPKSHYRTGKHAAELKTDAPTFHTVKPDLTKLERSTEDALTGVIWRDDSQVAVKGLVEKRYTSGTPGADIHIYEIH